MDGGLLPEQKAENIKKSLLLELKRSNRRDFLLCDYCGNFDYSIKTVSILF